MKFWRSLTARRHYGIVTAVSSGVFTVIALVCLCGICVSSFDMPEWALSAAMSIALIMGGYITGYTFGRHKRRQGIKCGLESGVVLLIITALFGVLYMRSVSVWVLLRETVFIIMPSVIGGIAGANRKNYKAP